MKDQLRSTPYTGTDNLEVMVGAKKYNSYILQLIASRSSQKHRILDFGAGIGTFALELSRRGFSVAAFDPEPKHQEQIVAKGLAAPKSLETTPPQLYDTIYTLNVLEHIQDDAAVLGELNQLLPVGGRLLIYVPALPWLFSSMDEKVGHYRRYTRGGLGASCLAAGYAIQEARYVDVMGIPATIAYKLFGSRMGDLNPKAIRFYDRFVFPISLVLDKIFKSVGGKNLFVHAIKTR